MGDLADLFRLATAAVEPVVDAEPDPLAETPCADWNYAQLLGHLVGGDRLYLRILTAGPGRPPAAPPEGLRMAPDPDRPPPSPDDYREHSGRLAAALADPRVLAGTFELPVGRQPGPRVAVIRSVEHLLHGWDLAKSGGVSTSTLEPVAEALMEPALTLLAAVGDRTLADRRPFASPVEVEPGTSTLTRFVASFGRDPGWEPDPVAGYDRVRERFVGYADVTLPDGSRRGFGADGMRVHGSIFAAEHRGRLMLKLPEDETTALIGAGLGLPMSKPGQRPWREWVLVPFDGSAGARAERAYAFVRAQGLTRGPVA